MTLRWCLSGRRNVAVNAGAVGTFFITNYFRSLRFAYRSGDDTVSCECRSVYTCFFKRLYPPENKWVSKNYLLSRSFWITLSKHYRKLFTPFSHFPFLLKNFSKKYDSCETLETNLKIISCSQHATYDIPSDRIMHRHFSVFHYFSYSSTIFLIPHANFTFAIHRFCQNFSSRTVSSISTDRCYNFHNVFLHNSSRQNRSVIKLCAESRLKFIHNIPEYL